MVILGAVGMPFAKAERLNREVMKMKCSRCGGTMVYEKVYTDTEQCWTWKCLYCGDYVDPVILENREFQRTRRTSQRRQGFIEDSVQDYSGA